jgi:predicted transcriptional regulator of viral defense system
MPRDPVLKYVRRIRRPVFTTREVAALSGKTPSAATQGLNYLTRLGVLVKIRRGLWAEAGNDRLSPLAVVPYIVPGHRAYVSFVSALHFRGVIEQIPHVITVASTAHSKTIRTPLGTYRIHRISPEFFSGFDWYGKGRDVLMASPEKALVDSLYLSAHRKKQYRFVPELRFPASFSFKRAEGWARRIPSPRTRTRVLKELERLKTDRRRFAS